MNIGFDLISDLNLAQSDQFNWEGKATSLYCVVAGNVSSHLNKVAETLTHLGKCYQGVMYIMGSLEYQDVTDLNQRTNEILETCRVINNVSVLYRHVVIIDGVAVLAANGWYGNTIPTDPETNEKVQFASYEDIAYLKNSLEKLQTHLDVKKILVVTNSVPSSNLYFGEAPAFLSHGVSPSLALVSDTQQKVSHWVFGTYEKTVDMLSQNITYVNNGYFKRDPYWAKRVDVVI